VTEQKVRFKVLLFPKGASFGAATTKTFDSRADAEDLIKKHGEGWQGEIIDVDVIGRPINPRTVPLASAGLVGGIEQYACTHCHFVSDLPGVEHNCAEFGRDDSFSMEPKASTSGTLTATPIQRVGAPPREYLVDWVSEGAREKWRALLRKDELQQLRATGGWHGEVGVLESYGVLAGTTFDMDAAKLQQFRFRHLRRG
jgi:hypothetical protein